MKRVFPILLVLALPLLARSASVAPYMILLGPDGTGSVTVTTGVQAEDVEVTAIYASPATTPDGTLYLQPLDPNAPTSLVPYLRFAPSRFTLPPNSSQIVRFLLTDPEGLPPESWARLVVTSKAASLSDKPRGVTIQLRQSFGITFRRGRPTVALEVTEPSATITDTCLAVSFGVERTPESTGAFLGTAKAELLQGDRVVASYSHNLVVCDLPLRSLYREPRPAAGEYTVRVTLSAGRADLKGLIAPNACPPISFSLPLSVQP